MFQILNLKHTYNKSFKSYFFNINVLITTNLVAIHNPNKINRFFLVKSAYILLIILNILVKFFEKN